MGSVKLEDDFSSEDYKLSKSCDSCKSRKVKCDGNKPLCSYCIRNKTECRYSPMKRPGLKRGYGKEFSQRLEAVENKCASVDDELAAVRSDVQVLFDKLLGLESSGSLPISNATPALVLASRNATPQTVSPQDTVQDSAQAKDPTKERTPMAPETRTGREKDLGTIPELPNLPPLGLLVSLYFERVHPAFPILHKDSIISKIREDPNCIIKYAIVLLTLKYVDEMQLSKHENTAYFTLCKEKIILRCISMVTLEQLQAMTLLAYQSFGSLNNPETWSFISLIASAVTHLGLTKETNNSQHMQFLDKKVRRPSIATSSDHGQSPNTPPSTNTPNSQTTNPQSAKKRKSISSNPARFLKKPDNWVEEESRRRLFWGVYILDVFSAISNSFLLKIPGDEITCMLPVKHSLWYWQTSTKNSPTLSPEGESVYDTEELYDSFAYYVELLHVLGEIHLFLRKQVDIFDSSEVYAFQKNFLNLYNRLLKWKSTIPVRYQNLMDKAITWDGMTQMDFNLASLYHTAMIRLNSAIGYPHAQSEYLSSSKIARDSCLVEVETLSKMIHTINTQFYPNDDVFGTLGPCFGFTLWVAGRLLLVDTINKEASAPPPEEDVLVNGMVKLGKYWGCASRYAMIIRFLMGETMNVRRKTIYSSKSKGKASNDSDEDEEDSDEHTRNSKIFSDMRNNAYVLDFIFSKKIPNLNNSDEAQTSVSTNSPPNQFSFQNKNGVMSNVQYFSTNSVVNSPGSTTIGSLQQFQKQQQQQKQMPKPTAQQFSGVPQSSQLLQPVESLENIFQWFKFPVNLNANDANGFSPGEVPSEPATSPQRRKRRRYGEPVVFAGIQGSQPVPHQQHQQQPQHQQGSEQNGLRNFNMFDVDFELSPSQASWDPSRDWLDNSFKT